MNTIQLPIIEKINNSTTIFEGKLEIDKLPTATKDNLGLVQLDDLTINTNKTGIISVAPQIINDLGKSNIKLIVNTDYIDDLSFPESAIIRNSKIPTSIGINTQLLIDNPFGNDVPVLCIIEIFAEGKWGQTGCYTTSETYGVSCECSLGNGLFIGTGTGGLNATKSSGLGSSVNWTISNKIAPIRILVFKIGNETADQIAYKLIVSGTDTTTGEHIVREPLLPEKITNNATYEFPNPFGVPCITTIELSYDNITWHTQSNIYEPNYLFYGLTLNSNGSNFILTTGTNYLNPRVVGSEAPNNEKTEYDKSAYCRIHCWAVKNTRGSENNELEIFQYGISKGQANALDFDFANIDVKDSKATISVDVQTNGHSSQPIGFTSVQPWTEKVVVSDAGVWLKLDGSPIDRYAYPEISNNFKILIPQTDIPIMTATTTGTYTASASSECNSSYPAYKAFNGVLVLPSDNSTNSWLSAGGAINATTGVVNNQWLQITNTVPFKITGYGLDLFGDRLNGLAINPPVSWTFAGSNDGTTWTILDTRNDITPGKLFFTIPTDAIAYSRYRITITKALINYTSHMYISIPEMYLFTDKFKLANIPVDSNSWYTYVKVKEAPYNEKFRGVPGKDALSKHMAYKLIVSGTDTTTTGDFVVREPLLPKKIVNSKSYSFPNPFGDIPCICEVEVFIGGVWCVNSHVFTIENSYFGFTLNSNTSTFVLTTGMKYVTTSNITASVGGTLAPCVVTPSLTSVPIRIHCWAIQSTPVFPYIYTTRKMSAVGDWDTFNLIEVSEDWHERNGDLLTDCSVLYPDFIDYVIAHPELCCTEAEWQSYSIAASGTGGVPFYVIDIENDTIRLPDTRGDVIIHGTPPLWKTDAIRNITGTITMANVAGYESADGAFKLENLTNFRASVQSSPSHSKARLDASIIIPTDTTNHPRIINQLGCICLKNVYLEPPRPNLGHIKEFLFEAPIIGYEEMDGRILSNISTIYPDFITWLNADINTDFLITEAQYQSYLVASSGTGGVPYFVYNKDSDTLRLPDMRNDSTYVSPSIDKFGKFESDAQRHITGNISRVFTGDISGVFRYETIDKGSRGDGSQNYNKAIFDNSRQSPVDITNHPRRVGVKMCIYLGRKAIQPEGAN